MKKKLRYLLLIYAKYAICSKIWGINDTCIFNVKLNNVVENKLEVEFTPPSLKSDTAVYRLPTTVPGTYEILDFGRFVSSFKALDAKNNVLPVISINANSWKIVGATQLKKIIYKVEDTWHTQRSENFIFEPAGTNIESEKNFVINTFGFFGYMDGYKNNPVSLTIHHPENMFGSTCLTDVDTAADKDIFMTGNYDRLADSPIMYCMPDTTMLHVGGADILVSVYSQNKKVTSAFIADNIKVILEAQRRYLGGSLPIKKYAFIIYLFSGKSRSGSLGALEHSYSSFYYLEESSPDAIVQSIRDFAAHEFFHIITPLGIHSYEIGDFNFASPKMSKHLWLYEGVTEYFSGHVQAKYNIISNEDYLNILKQKLKEASEYIDTLPFTTMSEGCLNEYKSQYMNVYEKGALIGLCLDIKLLALSSGRYRLNTLVMDLFKKYGPDKSFNDDELFDTIIKMTHPEIEYFFKTYVEGTQTLPLSEIFSLVGIKYENNKWVTVAHVLGGAGLEYDADAGIFIINKPTSTAKKMGFRKNDRLVSINNSIVTPLSIKLLMMEEVGSGEKEDAIVTVKRKNIWGVEREINIKSSKPHMTKFETHIISFDKNCTDEQLRLRNLWLGKL